MEAVEEALITAIPFRLPPAGSAMALPFLWQKKNAESRATIQVSIFFVLKFEYQNHEHLAAPLSRTKYRVPKELGSRRWLATL